MINFLKKLKKDKTMNKDKQTILPFQKAISLFIDGINQRNERIFNLLCFE